MKAEDVFIANGRYFGKGDDIPEGFLTPSQMEEAREKGWVRDLSIPASAPKKRTPKEKAW